MENLDFLFAGFSVIWLLLIGYFVVMHRKQKAIDREINILRDEIGVE